MRRFFVLAAVFLVALFVAPRLVFAAPPSATTTPATMITTSSASLNGTGTPNGELTTGWYRLSPTNPGTCNDSFGTRVPAAGGTDLGSGAAAVAYSINTTGLSSGVTYYFCSVVSNASGTAFGQLLTFTVPGTPVVTTTGASDLTSSSVTLQGSANPTAASATGYFRYHTADPGTCNDTFGTRAPIGSGGQALGSGTSPVDYTRGISGLLPGTTYWFCAIASNVHGTSFGVVQSFTTLPAAPSVTTSSATLVTTNSARLNGSGIARGASTLGWFRFSTTNPGSCNDTFGTRTPAAGGTDLGSANGTTGFSADLSGLPIATTYWFCAIAENSVGKSFGAPVSFTTLGTAPSVTTNAPNPLNPTTATLQGTATPNGASTTVWFRYATTNPGTCTDSFGTRAPTTPSLDPSIGAGLAPVNFNRAVSPLVPGTTYYACALASNSYGTTVGNVVTFTTPPAVPQVTTSAATLLTGTSAQLNGSANPGAANTTGYFRYATTNPGACNDTFGTRAPASSGSSLGNGVAPVAYSQGIAGLVPGTTYYFCAIAENSAGTGFGSVASFITPLPPVVTTTAASTVTNTAATLNGTGTSNNATTTAYFRYSLTDPGTCNDTFGSRAPVSGGTTLGPLASGATFSQSVTGLSPGTQYWFCAIGSNSEGLGFGAVLTFTTPTAPETTTDPATLITSTGAQLNGRSDPNLNAAFGYFRYSATSPGACNDTFGTRTPNAAASDTPLGAGTVEVPFARTIAGLTPATTYYFCAIGRNSYGTTLGALLSFTTLANPPSVTTSAASSLTGTTAQLNGSANPGGSATTAWFRFATASPGTCNDTFGTRAPSAGGDALGSGNTSVAYSEGITGLNPGTTYYVCAIAMNGAATSYGNVVMFTTPTPPSVVTNAATAVTNVAGTLNGSANPNGSTTTAYFRYSATNPGSCNDTFGSRAPASGGTTLSGTTLQGYSQPVSALSADTTYYYCAIASSAEGVAFGSVLTFTTAAAPATTTNAASSITSSGATLNGSAIPKLNPAFGYFRYGTANPGTCSDAFGTRAPPMSTNDSPLGAGGADVPFTRGISGLAPATTYYVCAAARNTYGTTFGAVMSFTTAANGPAVTTNAATLLTGTTAQLNGSANPGGSPTNGWFRYSTASPGACNDTFGTRAPTAGGSALGSGAASTPYSQGITGLLPGTQYFFCAIAENGVGISFGNVVSFTTPLPPTVATNAASSLTNTTAQLNGTANPNGATTTGYFRYSATNPGTCNDTFGSRAPTSGGSSLGAGTTATPYNQSVSGLSAGSTYYFCAIASSPEGTAFGAVLSFTTHTVPTTTTVSATPVTSTGATLNGSAIPNGNAAFGFFRYSATNPGTCNDTFGTRIPNASTSDTPLNAGTADVPFSRAIAGLLPSTTYYYCAIARNSYGTTVGQLLTFTTLANPPAVTTNSATLLTGTTAQLNGSANPGGSPTTGYFRYSTTSPGTCNNTFGTRAPAAGGSNVGSGTSSAAYSQPITGLSPGTTYFFCAIADNAVGTGMGLVASFTTPTPPSVTTTAASSVTNTGATLNGTANPNGSTTTGYFRYGLTDPGTCNDTFGSRAPIGSGGSNIGSGTSASGYSQVVTGLSPNTTYFFCAIASSAEGVAFGNILTFTTPDAPTTTTSAATSIASSSVTFNGSADPNGNGAFGYFRYGTTNPITCSDSYGTRWPTAVASDTSLGAGTTDVPFTRALTGLAAGTTYYFCAAARNGYGTAFGTVLSFTTLPTVPTVTTNAASGVSTTAGTLNGSANPHGSLTDGWFRYSTASPGTCNDTFGTRAPTSGGTALGGGTTAAPFAQSITGLTPGTTYYYCAIAQNSVGIAFGAVGQFTTTAPPTVATLAATPVTATTATFNGSVDPNGFATTGWFRYSTTSPGACDTTFGAATTTQSLGAGTTPVALTQPLTNLTPATTYYFCAIGSSSIGTTLGELLSFTTPANQPGAVTVAASDITDTTATLNATVNANGDDAIAWFRFAASNPGSCNDTFGTRAPASGGTSVNATAGAVPVSMNVSGLVAGTTYYFCAIAQNDIGTSYGSVLSFTAASLPAVVTSAATAIGSGSATLNGSGDPNFAAATGWFRYSSTNPGTCDDTFGTRAPANGGSALGAGANAVPYNQPVTGLSPSTTYYFCAIAQNVVGTGFGAVMSFTTPSSPTVTTSAASSITATTATINGSGNPNLLTATGWFRYATANPGTCNDAFGTRTPASGGTALGAGSADVPYNRPLTGLASATTYYYCAIASNSAGSGLGAVMSFTTAGAPSVTTNAATAVTTNSASLNGAASPNLITTTGWFRYSTTNPVTCNDSFGTRAPGSGGTALGAGSAPVDYTQPVTGLASGATYYFCAIAQNSSGIRFGTVQSFTTAAAPTVTTAAATSVTSSAATLNGSGNPRGLDATGWFRYATTNPVTCNDTFGTRTPGSGGAALGNGQAAVPYSEIIAGLTGGTTYYYCAIASSSAGTGLGTVMSFTTPAAPTVTTSAATGITSGGATLNGTADPNLDATTAWFRYDTTNPGSCNDTFGTRAPATGGFSAGSGGSAVPYSQAITGLSSSTTYYFCAIASNAIGTSFGTVSSFSTPAAPTMTTSTASAITSTAATLNGEGTPNLLTATGWFRYSTVDPGSCNDSFGTRAPATGGTALGNGSAPVPYSRALTGLAPSTTYYYCAIGSNSAGTGLGQVLSFRTAGPPSVVTNVATGVTANGAVLAGAANPNLLATTGWFRYSSTNPGTCNDTFGTRAPGTGGATLGNGASPVDYTQPITGLTAGTTYYYCAIASNSAGLAFGSVMTVTALPPPAVTTSAATSVGSTTATLEGSANPNQSDTVGWFRYSATNPGACNDTFGTRAPGTGGTPLGNGTAPIDYSQPLSGLNAGTTYYFCAIAQSAGGTSFGSVLSFTTTEGPAVTTTAASAVASTSATLNGSGDPNMLATTGWFRYASTDPGTCDDTFGTRAPTTGGTALGSGNAPVAYAQGLTGLTPGTTYYFCAIAENAASFGFGQVLSFTTTAAPEVTTLPATAVTSTTAIVNGTANPRTVTSTGWLRYDTTNPGTCNDTFGTRAPATGGTALGAGSAPVPYFEALAGLDPETTYYFCAIAQNAVGTSFGEVLTFTTSGVPVVTTEDASDLTPTTATLNGTANALNSDATAWFRWDTTDPVDCDDTFGTRAPASGGTTITASTGATDFEEAITGLTPGDTIYVCAIAQNASGVAFGEVVEVTVPTLFPTVTTDPATQVTSSAAELNGTANPNGDPTTGWLRFSTTDPGDCDDTFGERVPATGGTDLGSGVDGVSFSESVTDLEPGVEYFYCAIAENSFGTGFGEVLSFVAGAEPPVVVTSDAIEITGSGATLRGAATPRGSEATGYFRLGDSETAECDDSFGERVPASGGFDLGSGNASVEFEEPVVDLEPGTTYWFCAAATNDAGAAFGEVLSFTTAPAPVVETLEADYVGGGDVTLAGSVNAMGFETTGWFRFSAEDPGACDDTFGTRRPLDPAALGAGEEPVEFTELVTDLEPGKYFYCAIAENENGIGFGELASFEVPEEDDVVDPEDEGCSCRAVGTTQSSSSLPFALVGLALVVALRRRRRAA